MFAVTGNVIRWTR